RSLPDITKLQSCFNTSMNQVYLCSRSPDYVFLNEVSDTIINAFVISEDASFYHHEGFDWDEIKLTIQTNLERLRFARGGSTITQQLAKNVFLNSEKSLLRKIKEAYLANKMEKLYSKDVILEKYLNVVELGPGLYGVKRASQHYFGKDPSEINI